MGRLSVFLVVALLMVAANGLSSSRVPIRRVLNGNSASDDDLQGTTGRSNLTNNNNIYYTGEIQLGTPPQTLTVIFDTESTHLWVYSHNCWWSWPCWLRKTFNKGSSSSYISHGKHATLKYLNDKIAGQFASDKLAIGGNSKNVTFIEATKTTAGLVDTFKEKYDGVFGIGYPTSKNNFEILESYFEFFKVQPAFTGFSMYFKKDSYDSQAGGEIVFGDVDTTVYQPETLRMYDLAQPDKWAINIDKILVEGKSAEVCLHGCTTLLDTSTTDIMGPHDEIKALLGWLSIDDSRMVKCNDINKYPSITLLIGALPYTIEPKDYIIVQTSFWGVKSCRAAISVQPDKYWVLGDAFLSKFYSVWDVKSKKFGLAQLKSDVYPIQ